MIVLVCTCSVCIVYMAHSDSCMADPALQRIQRHTACLCGITDSNQFNSAQPQGTSKASCLPLLSKLSCPQTTGLLCHMSELQLAFSDIFSQNFRKTCFASMLLFFFVPSDACKIFLLCYVLTVCKETAGVPEVLARC